MKIDIDDLERRATAVVASRTALELAQWNCTHATNASRWREEHHCEGSGAAMNHCMRLSAALFDPFRTPPTFVRHPDGTIDEAMHMTPPMFAMLARMRRGRP